MAHNISGLVAHRETIGQLKGVLAQQPHFGLAEGFRFLPLDHENLPDIVGLAPGETMHPFNRLTTPLIDVLRAGSEDCTFIYVETDYFGSGGQGAVVFRRGRIRFGPEFTQGRGGAINDALAWLGVTVRPPCVDAFETIGL